jgi:CRP-like cAMP-binding protein
VLRVAVPFIICSRNIIWTGYVPGPSFSREQAALRPVEKLFDIEHRVLPKVSQETLAEMIGTTRSRVNFFMNKFRKLGFIKYNGEIHVDNSLLSVVLHD